MENDENYEKFNVFQRDGTHVYFCGNFYYTYDKVSDMLNIYEWVWDEECLVNCFIKPLRVEILSDKSKRIIEMEKIKKICGEG